jgi:hypothetical protein
MLLNILDIGAFYYSKIESKKLSKIILDSERTRASVTLNLRQPIKHQKSRRVVID